MAVRFSLSHSAEVDRGVDREVGQGLECLRRQLDKAREELTQLRAEVAQLAAIEGARELTQEESTWASRLRMESERLRHELRLIRTEFVGLRRVG